VPESARIVAAGSVPPAAVEQEQRIRLDRLGRFAPPQFTLRRVDRCPEPLPRVVGGDARITRAVSPVVLPQAPHGLRIAPDAVGCRQDFCLR